jgi:hypothetical protein
LAWLTEGRSSNRVKNLEQYITNGLMHDGVRMAGGFEEAIPIIEEGVQLKP